MEERGGGRQTIRFPVVEDTVRDKATATAAEPTENTRETLCIKQLKDKLKPYNYELKHGNPFDSNFYGRHPRCVWQQCTSSRSSRFTPEREPPGSECEDRQIPATRSQGMRDREAQRKTAGNENGNPPRSTSTKAHHSSIRAHTQKESTRPFKHTRIPLLCPSTNKVPPFLARHPVTARRHVTSLNPAG
jgi:hypothetical protein